MDERRYTLRGVPAQHSGKRRVGQLLEAPFVRLHLLPAGIPWLCRDPEALRQLAAELVTAAVWLEGENGVDLAPQQEASC